MSTNEDLRGLAQHITFGIPVYETHALPFEPWYDACDLQTKQQHRISSGEMVHAIILPDTDITKMLETKETNRKKIMVSPELYKEIKQLKAIK